MMSYCWLRHDCLTYSLRSLMQTNGDVTNFSCKHSEAV